MNNIRSWLLLDLHHISRTWLTPISATRETTWPSKLPLFCVCVCQRYCRTTTSPQVLLLVCVHSKVCGTHRESRCHRLDSLFIWVLLGLEFVKQKIPHRFLSFWREWPKCITIHTHTHSRQNNTEAAKVATLSPKTSWRIALRDQLAHSRYPVKTRWWITRPKTKSFAVGNLFNFKYYPISTPEDH